MHILQASCTLVNKRINNLRNQYLLKRNCTHPAKPSFELSFGILERRLAQEQPHQPYLQLECTPSPLRDASCYFRFQFNGIDKCHQLSYLQLWPSNHTFTRFPRTSIAHIIIAVVATISYINLWRLHNLHDISWASHCPNFHLMPWQ